VLDPETLACHGLVRARVVAQIDDGAHTQLRQVPDAFGRHLTATEVALGDPSEVLHPGGLVTRAPGERGGRRSEDREGEDDESGRWVRTMGRLRPTVWNSHRTSLPSTEG